MSNNPNSAFRRVNAFMQAIQTMLSQGFNLQSVAAELGEYRSRGHGRGKISGKKRGNHCTNWRMKLLFQTNGARETARRRRQIAAGILTESNSLMREVRP